VSAKGTRRCLAESGSAATMICTRIRAALDSSHVATGEAECAMTQTVHFASSRELECWCSAKLYAANSISSRQSHAIGFKADRMKSFPTERVN
jgi:hypothetical protein